MEQVRYIKRVALFLAIALVLYPVYMVIWSLVLPIKQLENVRYPMGGGGHMHTRIAELKDHPPVDVVFLGSSHTYRSFDPRLWASAGYTSFNLGSSAQSPIQTELIVNEYVDALAPKLIILEIYGMLGNLDGVESSLDLIANRRIDGATIRMALEANNMKVYNSLIYGYIRQLSGKDKDFIEPITKPTDRYISGGYDERIDGTFHAETISSPKFEEPLKFQWNAFMRTLGTLEKRGYKVVLLRTPTTKAHSDRVKITSPDQLAWLAQQKNYLDMTTVQALSDTTYFYDLHHLNSTGVAAFNTVLMDTLNSLGYLPLEH